MAVTLKEIAIMLTTQKETLENHIAGEDAKLEREFGHLKETLDEIKEHVKFTNGKVAAVMEKQSEYSAFKAYITGAVATLTALVVPVLISVITAWLHK